MADPILWHAFAALFVIAGVMNLFRGMRRTDARRGVNIALGLSCFVWAVASAMLGTVGRTYAYLAAGAGLAIMVVAAGLGLRAQRQ